MSHLKRLVFLLTRKALCVLVAIWLEGLADDGVVVVATVVADADRLQRLVFVVGDLLVERAHGLARVGVDLDRAPVDLRESLDLEIVAPHLILALALAVKLDRTVDCRVDEVFEVVL